MNALSRLVELARERGPRGLWFATLAELGYRRVVVRECVLDADIPHVPARVPLTFEQLTTSQLDEYNEFCSPANPDAAVRQLEAGHRCFIARHNGAIVCACWAATGHAWSEYLSRPIALAPDAAYLYDLYTRPDFRELGIAAATRAEIYRASRAEGIRRVMSYVIPESRRSMSRHFRTVGTIGCLRIAGFRYDFARTVSGL